VAVGSNSLEAVYMILLVAGGVTALVADKLGLDGLKTAGIGVLFLAAIVFGLNMLVQRRAEIGTRYSSSINPSFHVFHGFGAIAWGVVFIVTGSMFVGYIYIWSTHWTAAQTFFSEHNGIVIGLFGILITALGVGTGTRATYRYKESEKPERRLADRLAAIVFIVPLGLVILGWGLIKTFAPLMAEAVRAETVEWVELLIKWFAK